MTDWGPFVFLPVLKIFGTGFEKCSFTSYMDKENQTDLFTQVTMLYPEGIASVRAGCGVKSEGSLVVSGTKAYIYVPAPWWKTEYFEIRYEDPNQNRRYFYKIEGEGIRYEIAEFLKLVRTGGTNFAMEEHISETISALMEEYLYERKNNSWI